MKLILWLWWMYCGYLFGVGGGDKKEYDKWYYLLQFRGKQSKQAHDPNTIWFHTFRYVSATQSTNDAKNKNKFKVFPAPRFNQITMHLKSFLFYIYFSFAESNQNKHMTPTRYDSTHFDTFPLLSLPMTLNDVINPDCAQWITLGIFLQIVS